MHILILNGSPKGQYSVTLQTINYLECLHPQHNFEMLHVGQRIKALEKDFAPALTAIEKADLILFSYPVYTFIAPYQLHCFMELLKASGVSLKGHFVSQITTSKHFYDVTAHRYIQDNCQDLGMKFIRGLSADMDDLLTKKGQKEAKEFFQYVCWCVENNHFEPLPAALETPKHVSVEVPAKAQGSKDGDVVIVTDCEAENTQLQNMIARFQAVLPRKTRVVNIREYPFKGGCLGCFNCAVSGKCIYNDGFDEFLRNEIQKTQAIVYAFSIKDHSMGAAFKQYDDRQFCNGHRTVTMGMPMGYLVSGSYSQEYNLQMIIEGRAQVGGMKIFRDLIWLMQGMMKADHKFYKAHGQYDFPQKKRGTMIKMYLVGALISNPKIKAKMGNAMNEGMIAPYKKLLDSI